MPNINKLFLDIETVPAGDDRHQIVRGIYDKKIEDGKKAPDTFEEYLSHTTFDGSFGRIICISYAINNERTETLSGDEKEILKSFWEMAKEINLFIGFNILGFDLRFIYQRSIVLKVRPSIELNFARYRNYPIYDVMMEWNKWDFGSTISLDTLAKALDIPSSKGGEVEGKNVAQAYKDGRLKEICEYCEKDVEVTRSIYKRLTFSE